MAIVKTLTESRAVLKYDYGVDANGKAVSKTKTISSIKPSATDQNLFDVVAGIVGLQEVPLLSFVREDLATIEQA